MESGVPSRVSRSYYIDLPIDEALYVRDMLNESISEIASEQGVDEDLRQANFKIRASEPAIDAGVVITVVVSYLGMKLIDKITDKTLDKLIDEIWLKKILPELRKRFGEKALVEEEE